MSTRNARLVKHKLASIPHPKDRKIDQLQRQMRHNLKREMQKDKRKEYDALTAARCFWFRCQLEKAFVGQPDEFYTPELVETMIQIHIDRNDEEIAELKAATKRIQHGRIKMLEEQKKHEHQLFGTRGFNAPDMCDKEVREIMLEIWDGDGVTVNCVPMTHVIRSSSLEEIKARKAELMKLLRPIEEVRDQQEADGVVSSKTMQFRKEKPVVKSANLLALQKSVKSIGSGNQVAKAGTERRLMQTKRRQAVARHAAMTKSRGLL